MDIKEFAKSLEGVQYGEELSESNIRIAKDNGFVVVFGASDDLMEFDGSISDEAGCFDGGDVYFDSEGVSYEPTNNIIKAVWGEDDVAWQYETTIPHETFTIYEEKSVYCKGIVFKLSDIR